MLGDGPPFVSSGVWMKLHVHIFVHVFSVSSNSLPRPPNILWDWKLLPLAGVGRQRGEKEGEGGRAGTIMRLGVCFNPLSTPSQGLLPKR